MDLREVEKNIATLQEIASTMEEQPDLPFETKVRLAVEALYLLAQSLEAIGEESPCQEN